MVRLTRLLSAVQFLTRIPVRLAREPDLRAAVPWFPTVGAGIGAVVGASAAAMWHLTPPLVAASVAVVVGLLVTGAFHEDGLADTADAFAGGTTVARRLEILKDPRHGSYGVAALAGSVILRATSLGALPGPAAMFACCVAAHAVARASAVTMMVTVRPAAATGLGADYTRGLRSGTAITGALAGVAVAGLAVGWWVGPLVLCGCAGVAATGAIATRKIGGFTGDVLGACEQVVEVVAFVVLSGLAAHYDLWWR